MSRDLPTRLTSFVYNEDETSQRTETNLRIEAADEIERLRTALATLIGAIEGHGHWDSKGTHGANCPICERQFAAKERARAVLRDET
jgi:hypothetical protein